MIELPALPLNTILLVEVGSMAHGTGKIGLEDNDEAAVVVETAAQVLGLSEAMKNVMLRTQPDGVRSGPGDTDRTLYTLRNFLKLAAAGNPSILMDFFAPVHLITPEGQALRDLAPSFIGRHIIPKYRGYMQSQGMALLGLRKGHGKRGGGQRQELVDQYGFDTKYMMHSARLGLQCIELLTTGKLLLPIQGEPRDWLRRVRHGEVTFDEWWSRSLELDQRMVELMNDDTLAPTADHDAIEAFSVWAHGGLWSTRQ